MPPTDVAPACDAASAISPVAGDLGDRDLERVARDEIARARRAVGVVELLLEPHADRPQPSLGIPASAIRLSTAAIASAFSRCASRGLLAPRFDRDGDEGDVRRAAHGRVAADDDDSCGGGGGAGCAEAAPAASRNASDHDASHTILNPML